MFCEITFDPVDKDFASIIQAYFIAADVVESYIEDQVLKVYYVREDHSEDEIRSILEKLSALRPDLQFTQRIIEDTNWNALWESNYDPIRIGNDLYIRAPFHPEDPTAKFELLIEPRMSFGTGHHATTKLMLKAVLALDLKDRSVIDVGCGTAVLAILAAKKGANPVLAIDIDQNAYEIANENIRLNNTPAVKIKHGDIQLLEGVTADYVLANINKNVILNQLSRLVDAVSQDGYLILSGLMRADRTEIEEALGKLGLSDIRCDNRDDWICLHVKKT